jgi:hypothetical protein
MAITTLHGIIVMTAKPPMRDTFRFAVICSVASLLPAVGLAQGPRTDQAADASMRSYSAGPLTLADYQRAPPDDRQGLDALTTTDIRYNYNYQVRTTQRRAAAYLTDLSIDAVVLRSKSWTTRPSDRRLLDHEQGHFDITYISSLRARLELARMRAKGQRFYATGATSQAAVDGIKQKVEGFIQPFLDALLTEQREYDRVTSHGLQRDLQAEQRRKQLETIKTLVGELKKLDR